MKLKNFTFKKTKEAFLDIDVKTAVIIALLIICAISLSAIASFMSADQNIHSYGRLVKLSHAYQMLLNGTPRPDVILFLRSEGLTTQEISSLPDVKYRQPNPKTKLLLINGEKAIVTEP
jgi:hypothetical protein